MLIEIIPTMSNCMTDDIKPKKPKKPKPYFFCARISPPQFKKLQAFMFTSNASHATFVNGILDIFHMMCETGQEEVLRNMFGNEFYLRFFKNYLDNLYYLESKSIQKSADIS